MLSHLIQFQGMSSYLFKTTFASFKSVLEFSWYSLCPFLAKFISKYFIFSVAIMSSNSFLFMYKKAIDFCTLIFYPATKVILLFHLLLSLTL